jgi:hypothetical protein
MPQTICKQSSPVSQQGISRNSARPQFQLRAPQSPPFFCSAEEPVQKPRVRSLRDAADYFFFPERLAQTLGRPQKPEDNWLPISIPDRLARAFGCGVSTDAGRALLRQRLACLCQWLDTRLDEPPVVVEAGKYR